VHTVYLVTGLVAALFVRRGTAVEAGMVGIDTEEDDEVA
jgi:hypothetical protein